MKTLAFLICIGFISLSVFGFLGMLESSDMSHGANRCLASLAQNGACPPPEHTVASAIFHTNALKVFSTTLLADLALAALMFFAGFIARIVVSAFCAMPTVAERANEISAAYRAVWKFRLALARLEHSPTSR